MYRTKIYNLLYIVFIRCLTANPRCSSCIPKHIFVLKEKANTISATFTITKCTGQLKQKVATLAFDIEKKVNTPKIHNFLKHEAVVSAGKLLRVYVQGKIFILLPV